MCSCLQCSCLQFVKFCFFVGFNWTRDDIKNPDKIPLTYHRIVESLKFAYAPFTYLGDPKFTNHTKEVIHFHLFSIL